MINTLENQEKVARYFIGVLAGWFQADKGNDFKLTPEHILNANDYYDANMAMDEALNLNGIKTFNGDGHIPPDTMDLFNAAWERAAQILKS